MANNFEEFLDQADPANVEDAHNFGDEDADQVTGMKIREEDESKSVSRFCTSEKSPPSLSSLCIFRVSSWINEMTCQPNNNSKHKATESRIGFDLLTRDLTHLTEQVQDMFHNRIKMLPGDVQAKISTQLSLTALRCIHEERVWDLDPSVLAAGIKQEEDMLRYLFWKQPDNPLLKHFETILVTDLFKDKTTIDWINKTMLPPTDHVKEALVQSYLPKSDELKYVSKQEFLKKFEEFTNGTLKKIDWKNVLVVGGSVLRSLKKTGDPAHRHDRYNPISDIDIYLYGLTKEESQKKVKKIVESIQSCWREKIGIFKTANTITLVSDRNFVNVQIILSTYSSPMEILLASDMNSCSIGFNGESVLVIPRFLFGAIYGSNFLDSSTKFGTKLRWERITKYYKRGYNIVAPLYVRVHGHGSFTTPEIITEEVHPSTNQMIELMCLMKMVIMRLSHNQENFGIERESTFDDWPSRWIRGVHIASRSCAYEDDAQPLREEMPNLPDWVTAYYESRQSLIRPVIREAPRYADEPRDYSQLSWRNTGQNYSPEGKVSLGEYVQSQCNFDNYNESSLQCFHLNLFVNKEQISANPYKEMNTSMVTMKYPVETVELTFNDFKAYLSGDVKNISKEFNLHNSNWKLTLNWGSTNVSFITLTKEEDSEDKDSFNSTRYRPTKFFANFLIRIKNQRQIKYPQNMRSKKLGDIIFDGSQVFTYDKPDNIWLTWIYNKYYNASLNPAGESTIDSMLRWDQINGRPQYIKDGAVKIEIVMQLVQPHFNITVV